MPAQVNVHIIGLREAQRENERVVRALRGDEFFTGMRNATMIVERDARILAPVDTGTLRASITHEVRSAGNDVLGVVGSNVTYAPYMELGTGTFVGRQRHAPFSDEALASLEIWASRHGIGTVGRNAQGRFTRRAGGGVIVARAIYRRGGLRPRRFLQRSFEQNQRRIFEMIGNTVSRIVRP